MPHLFCFGYGFSMRALARELPGWQITGTRRSPVGLAMVRTQGAEALAFDGSAPLPPAALDGVTHLLISTPPSEKGDPVLRVMGDEIARRAGQFAWAGYLSTTGVYGDHGGEWVDEDCPLTPAGIRGQRRVAAEAAWRAVLPGIHHFRLAGIYGPGRNALASLRMGTARRIVKEGQIFSRVHAHDIAGVLKASMAKPNPGRDYNVCDDEPCPPQDVITYAAGLLGLEPPPLEDFNAASLSPMAASFYGESKRVSNARVKAELDYQFAYPSYREGLMSVLERA